MDKVEEAANLGYETAFKSLQDWAGSEHDKLLLAGVTPAMAPMVLLGTFVAAIANVTAQMDYSSDWVLDTVAFALKQGKERVKPRFTMMQ